ncbi:MAG: HNH endonuclease signature motif containing protein [Candidatus Thioglobus sp.]
MSDRDPSKERLDELFEYRDGKLFNKTNRRGTARMGMESGCKTTEGYRDVRVDGKLHRTHRVIWIMHNGDIPKNKFIDHENRIKDDNRIDNLRLVTGQENAFNTSAKGYIWHKSISRWVAYITLDGVQKHLGSFVKEEDAKEARRIAKKDLHTIEER